MCETRQNIEMTLTVTAADEVTAVRVAEILARAALGLSSEEGVAVGTEICRYDVHCHAQHETDEVEP